MQHCHQLRDTIDIEVSKSDDNVLDAQRFLGEEKALQGQECPHLFACESTGTSL